MEPEKCDVQICEFKQNGLQTNVYLVTTIKDGATITYLDAEEKNDGTTEHKK